MRVDSVDDLRPGDIMISGQNTAPNKIGVYFGQLLLGEHFRIGKFVAGHAGIVVPGGKLVEAMPSGARIRDLTPADWTSAQTYFRLHEDYPGQAWDAAMIAMAMVDTPYSIMSYVYLALFRLGFQPEWLAKRIDRRHQVKAFNMHKDAPQRWSLVDIPVEAICSVLAEQSWTLTGHKVIHGTRPQVVTPGMLTQQLWSRPGVLRFGASIL